MECPISRSGRTPQCRTSRNSAVSRANSAGWVYRVRSSSSAPGVPDSANRTSRRLRSRCGSRQVSTSSRASANTGSSR